VWRQDEKMFTELKQTCGEATEVIMKQLGHLLDEMKQTEGGRKVCELDSFGSIELPVKPRKLMTTLSNLLVIGRPNDCHFFPHLLVTRQFGKVGRYVKFE